MISLEAKLYIFGLPENSNPGDILGAVAGDANVSGDKVGNIVIHGSLAEVYVEEDVADKVVEDLDNVSGVSVLVSRADESEETRVHFLRLAKFVELERKSEMEKHEREIKKLSGYEREKEGRAILHLEGSDEGTGLGGKNLVKFTRQKSGETLPDTEIGIGDLVMLSKNDPLRDDNPTGTVSEKTNYSITVAFDRKPEGFLYGKGIRCDLYVNDITYQRQLDALAGVYNGEEDRLATLAEKALGKKDIEFGEIDSELSFLNSDLNDSQKESVKKAMSAQDFFLIHGPPGTGKTITSIEIARQLHRRGEDVLAVADSNIAVDNLVEWLAEAGEKVVRIGHPARVTHSLRSHTLDEIIQDNDKYKKSRELRKKAMSLLEKQEEFTHPGGRWRRGMSDRKIRELAKKERGSRGVPASRIKEMAKWLDLQEKIDELFEKVEKFEEEAIDEIIEWADIVCATNSVCGSELMSEREFDTVIIDEATQATEPSCWIPITLADRVILAGDHKQLPPTILNENAETLSKTMFERLVDIFRDEIYDTLRVQYRMNTDIMNFSNSEFYDGILEADESVAGHTLSDLIDEDIEGSDSIGEPLLPEKPIVFLDTAELDAEERTRKGSTSKENPGEAEIVFSLLSGLLESGVDPTDIAVISPYDDQVDLISREIEDDNLEADTVDGFQGREKEVVILSLVRSNQTGNIGFLDDVRRLNVSLTRAKRKLIIIGDSTTVGHHKTYSRLINYIYENGNIINAEVD